MVGMANMGNRSGLKAQSPRHSLTKLHQSVNAGVYPESKRVALSVCPRGYVDGNCGSALEHT